MSTPKFDLTVRSTILRGEKPGKGLDAVAAANPNLMNRLVAFLPDGKKVVVAQRHGKGGMDFNKLLGGKVFAVAADGMSPVYEKGEDKKPTKVQKLEDGLPLYSSSGFYLMSSKEYPALEMGEYFTLLRDKGAQAVLISEAQLANTAILGIESEFDLEMLEATATELLSDGHNLVAKFDATINRKRQRGIERAKTEAADAAEAEGATDPDTAYDGVEYKELAVSKKDGNPAVVVYWHSGEGAPQFSLVTREIAGMDDADRPIVEYVEPAKAWSKFTQSGTYRNLVQAVKAGTPVTVGLVQAHVMRTSVSFRRKAENVLAAPSEKQQYGDAVYIKGALSAWCRGLVSIMHSQHPNFPSADYDSHHYVVALRQAEIGMNKKADGSGWTPPAAIPVSLAELLPQNALATS